MSVETIGDGIKTRLETISALKRVYASDELPDSLNRFPCAVIMPSEITYQTTFTDIEPFIIFRIIVIVSKQNQPSALSKLLDYIAESGTNSVLAAINADSTLDSSASGCILDSNSGFGAIPWGNINYLGTEFNLRVWT